jgi:acyl-CoA reductase-like NAD-dependent aldehyde dehydrogenase
LRLILGAVVGAVQMLGASAPHVRRTGLELGGKGALIVLEDAPMTALVDWAMMGIFMTSGQVCCATSRLLVHVSRKDEVLEALRASAAAVRMGDPLDETTQMGAVITEEAALRLVGAVAQARAEGSILVCGGGRVAAGALPAALAGGYYVQPTVLADVPRSSSAWQVIALDCPRLPLIALDCPRLPSIALDCPRLPSIALDCLR